MPGLGRVRGRTPEGVIKLGQSAESNAHPSSLHSWTASHHVCLNTPSEIDRPYNGQANDCAPHHPLCALPQRIPNSEYYYHYYLLDRPSTVGTFLPSQRPAPCLSPPQLNRRHHVSHHPYTPLRDLVSLQDVFNTTNYQPVGRRRLAP
ncbi:hypothetical protein AG1IA_01241 [Rhizoctonia solani AG-1 IA]|uniref:Uncharacterized protein n=1 Tax=Thanatephorus cucumeris (strain AG1-IA) TaxID=983506 RepID=L8X3F3_THACA|nr:hypothetical protein AG1IA_01241 [Rhizoctonia solani AG-1 IA]